VVVTSGATEALTAAIMGLTGPGDEIVLFEPTDDSYRPIAEAVGASIRSLKLAPPAWRLTQEALAEAITPNTKVVMINSPLNPVARVFDQGELQMLADAVRKVGAVVISDEVYEHLTFDGRAHIPLATLPGMRERVVRIGSAGKIFSLTGWKVGWVTGPRALIDPVAKAHQFLTFTTSPALQLGIAHGLEAEMDYPLELTRRLQANRDILAKGLGEIGFEVLPSEGTYFLTAGISRLLKKEDGANEKDRAFCERLVREAGVALIPLSVFFADGTPDTYVRFAFCKSRPLVEEALERLKRYFAQKP
jgi:aspartate/methionine/tyrosine aminotransferase